MLQSFPKMSLMFLPERGVNASWTCVDQVHPESRRLFSAGFSAVFPYALLWSRSVTGKLKCGTFNLPKYANVF